MTSRICKNLEKFLFFSPMFDEYSVSKRFYARAPSVSILAALAPRNLYLKTTNLFFFKFNHYVACIVLLLALLSPTVQAIRSTISKARESDFQSIQQPLWQPETPKNKVFLENPVIRLQKSIKLYSAVVFGKLKVFTDLKSRNWQFWRAH